MRFVEFCRRFRQVTFWSLMRRCASAMADMSTSGHQAVATGTFYPLLSSQQGIVDTLDGGLPGNCRLPTGPPFTQAGSGCGCCHYNANDCEYWPNTINLTCTSCILTIAVESMHLQKTVCKKSRSLQLG